MLDIQSISTGLKLGDDGIWYAQDHQHISYPQGGNENCFAIEDSSFWFRHRNNCITSVVQTFPPEDDGAIFDIGGGNGFVSLGLVNAGFNVVLLEPGLVGAVNAKNRGLANVICATADTAKLKRHSLSAVGLFDVIEHIEDDLKFLQSIRSLVKPPGRLYATVPSYNSLWSEEDIVAGHFRRYTLAGISRVLELAGFQVEFSSYIFRFLPLPIFLFRSLPYKLGFSSKSGNVRKSTRDHAERHGVLAKMLNRTLQCEINNLDAKRTMRFGGSCLIVAKNQ